MATIDLNDANYSLKIDCDNTIVLPNGLPPGP